LVAFLSLQKIGFYFKMLSVSIWGSYYFECKD
jgi:hypothetical protein